MSWTAPNLPAEKHCFFGSEGGVSQGYYQSLNINIRSRDSQENIHENLKIIAGRFNLPTQALHIMCQGVSAKAVYVDTPTQFQMEADGAVTNKKDIILCIKTADCAPVLLADFRHGIIGAAHAGWRGAFRGIIENTIRLMLEKGACLEDIAAAVGPCIAQASYEVDENFHQTFLTASAAFNKYFSNGKKAGYYQFDLEEFCVDKLRAAGIKNITAAHEDTYAKEEKYFSFRRFTHRGQISCPGDFPTEISTITL